MTVELLDPVTGAVIGTADEIIYLASHPGRSMEDEGPHPLRKVVDLVLERIGAMDFTAELDQLFKSDPWFAEAWAFTRAQEKRDAPRIIRDDKGKPRVDPETGKRQISFGPAAGDEVHRLATEYMRKLGLKPERYDIGVQAILARNPELKQAYAAAEPEDGPGPDDELVTYELGGEFVTAVERLAEERGVTLDEAHNLVAEEQPEVLAAYHEGRDIQVRTVEPAPLTEPTDPFEPGEVVDGRAMEYLRKHSLGEDKYDEAMTAVLAADPALKAAYAAIN